MQKIRSIQAGSFYRYVMLSAFLIAFIGGAVLWSANKSAEGSVKWDAAAGKQLEHELMKLHESLNSMDIESIRQKVIGDDVLVTFDVDPDTLKPVKLTSQEAILQYTERFFKSLKKSGIVSKAEHPMIACRAVNGFGACTEECKIKLYLPDGSMQEQQLRASVLAVKQKDGWKWIQWHMSEAGPSYPIQK